MAALKEARNTEYSITEEARARINKTYADLELNAKVGGITIMGLLDNDIIPV